MLDTKFHQNLPQFSFMNVGIFYLELFPNKMTVYVTLRFINPSTIRREISFRNSIVSSFVKVHPYQQIITGNCLGNLVYGSFLQNSQDWDCGLQG